VVVCRRCVKLKNRAQEVPNAKKSLAPEMARVARARQGGSA